MAQSDTQKSNAKRNALGRGLMALMTPSTGVAVTPKNHEKVIEMPLSGESAPKTPKDLCYMSLELIVPNPTQPRQEFSEVELNSLATSIKESGLLQPLLVRKGKDGKYEIVAGERRWRASKLAGLTEVPVIIKDINDKETLALAIVENVQRENLNPMEEAEAYNRLINEHGENIYTIAKFVGKSESYVSNIMRLLDLAPDVQEMVRGGSLTAGHGRALVSTGDFKTQREFAKKILREGLSVRALEKWRSNEINRERRHKKAADTKRSALNVSIEERMRRALGTKVHVRVNAQGVGEIRIAVFSTSEIESFLDKIGA